LVIAALASVTMMVLKLDIIESRVEDAHHTFVPVPVISTVSNPRARNR
jgi:hypothetical protein